jgi:hypothetical protein
VNGRSAKRPGADQALGGDQRATVAYGANGLFAYRVASNAIVCDNATFGYPAPGVFQACYYRQ